MSKMRASANAKDNITSISFREFLEKQGPSTQRRVSDLCSLELAANRRYQYTLNTPEIQLHCDDAGCQGPRYFRYFAGQRWFTGKTFQTFMTYRCSNCLTETKLFSLYAEMAKTAEEAKPDALTITMEVDHPRGGLAYKHGEFPAFGPKTPTRLQKLLGDQLDTFFKGRRCEAQGLGIGAFVYYRRVVEHQKNRFLTEILSAAKILNAPADQIAALEGAIAETQFTKALQRVKDALPQALLVLGHNPLTLLHSALSAGVHEDSDAECLALAQHIRVVLVDLAERLSQVLKDNAELKEAVSRLLKKKAATAK